MRLSRRSARYFVCPSETYLVAASSIFSGRGIVVFRFQRIGSKGSSYDGGQAVNRCMQRVISMPLAALILSNSIFQGIEFLLMEATAMSARLATDRRICGIAYGTGTLGS